MSDVQTSVGMTVSNKLLKNYFRNLINQFFKILPMRENGENTLSEYMKSLQRELMGAENLIPELKCNSLYMSLLSILQYLIDNIDNDNFTTLKVRREIFKAISICEKLKSVYASSEVIE